MTRSLIALTACALITACGASDTTDESGESAAVSALRQALPESEEMALRIPSAMALTPDQATFYGFTRGVTLGVNHFVRVISNAVQDITELPPTETDGETFAVWGPHTAPLSPATWRVRVDRVAKGHFTYVVEAWPKGDDAADAKAILEGEHRDAEGTRSGTWVYDMTRAHAVEPLAHESTGRVSVAYTFAADRTLEVHFDEVQSRNDPNVTSTLYRYTEDADRAGTLDYIANLDIHADDDPDLDRRELLQVRSRWKGTGPGRADVLATHGDLPEGVSAELSECWDDAFARTWMSLAWADFEQVDGDPAQCPFEDVQRPMFADFDPDAFADGDLVAALPTPADLAVEPAAVADPVARPATYYLVGRSVVLGVVNQVGWVLAVLQQITKHPPTDCEPGRCTWGPWTDWEKGVSSQVVVERDDDEGSFRFEVRTWRFGDAADARRVWLRGGYQQGATEREGQGWFDLDLDVSADLDPDEEAARGQVRAEFSRMGDRRQLAMRLDGVTDDNGEPQQGRYFVDADPAGGLLELRFPVEVGDDPSSPRELAEGTIRWQPDGAGVANIRASEGDLGDTESLAVECWDDTAARTHQHWIQQDVGSDGHPDIDGAACVFDDWLEPVLAPLGDEG